MSEETQKDLPKDQESPTQQDLPKEQEAKELSFAEKGSSSISMDKRMLQKAFFFLGNLGFLVDTDDEEDTSPPDLATSSKRPFNAAAKDQTKESHGGDSKKPIEEEPLEPHLSPPDSAMPSKRPHMAVANDEEASQGKEKKKKKEPHGGDTKKEKEGAPLEPYLVRLSSDLKTEISLYEEIIEYRLQKNVDPFDNVLFLQDFITNCLHEDVLPSNLIEETEKLKKKYKKAVAEIQRTLNSMFDRGAFEWAHAIWSVHCETDFLVDFKAEKDMTEEEEISRTRLESEIGSYFRDHGTHPFTDNSSMSDFIQTQVGIKIPAEKFLRITQALRKKYQKKAKKMIKNVNVDGYAFGLAKTIWGAGLNKKEGKRFLRFFKEKHDLSLYPYLSQASVSHIGSSDGNAALKCKRIEEEFWCMERWEMEALDEKCKELYLERDNFFLTNFLLKQKLLLFTAYISSGFFY